MNRSPGQHPPRLWAAAYPLIALLTLVAALLGPAAASAQTAPTPTATAATGGPSWSRWGIDAAFGAGGTVTTDLGGTDHVAALAAQPDGQIVAAGTSDVVGSYRVARARYRPDG